MKGSFEVGSVEETWEVARRLAADLAPGSVVCLEGDLGSGKTTFVQGLAAALGVPGRVTSPTFCLVQEHGSDGGPFLVHMDLYRLSSEDDVLAISRHAGKLELTADKRESIKVGKDTEIYPLKDLVRTGDDGQPEEDIDKISEIANSWIFLD